jgi:hypothetical protein
MNKLMMHNGLLLKKTSEMTFPWSNPDKTLWQVLSLVMILQRKSRKPSAALM